jgi:rod shape-determining protein MreC
LNRNKRNDILVVIGLVALGFLLGKMQTTARNQGRTDPISGVVRAAIAPAASGMNALGNASSDFGASIFHGRSLQEENRRLKSLTASAEMNTANIDRLQTEVDELRRMAGWLATPGRERVPADVVGFFPREDRITINVGLDKGVKRGMPVATYEGLVGRVETVDRSSSQVLLITAPSIDSRISALVQRPAPNPPPAGLLRGEGPGTLSLELADATAAVESGDIVVTSGFSEQIPRGIVIGKVVSIQDDAAFGKRTATIFPRVSLGQVREVLVIK